MFTRIGSMPVMRLLSMLPATIWRLPHAEQLMDLRGL
ncbi:hypothetical protein ACO22_07447 [Paracoccidioides brasiliensis]|uniref:Uncharacterized protein n=1 Tax=Paracoccidioides brasiliensis TaxID=121759 RepID=A0A1D2J4L2_PARBR|nr:hypothetical protein ACO22_07447 [Paracoccidioides brasiliensis]